MKHITKLDQADLYNEVNFINEVYFSTKETDEIDLEGGGITINWSLEFDQREWGLYGIEKSVEKITFVLTDNNENEDWDIEMVKVDEGWTMLTSQGSGAIATSIEGWSIELNTELEKDQFIINGMEVFFESKTIELT